MSEHTKTHPLEWVALGFAVVALSYSEWSLAVAAGAHPVVAVAVPGALDVYAVRAMRTRRHVPMVVLAMVGVNALSYLVHAKVVPMTWPVLVIVSAIAPLVFWAVHVLGHGEHANDAARARRRKLWGVPGDAHVEGEHVLDRVPGFFESAPDTPGHAVPDDWEDRVSDVLRVSGPVPEPPLVPRSFTPFVPRDESVPPEAEHVLCEHGWYVSPGTVCEEHHPLVGRTRAQHLRPVPAGQAQTLSVSVPVSELVSKNAREHAQTHRAWFEAHTDTPTVRSVKTQCRVGTDTAKQILRIWKGEVQ